jgi:DNA invertase Pin-like site-specific DNA recombinase
VQLVGSAEITYMLRGVLKDLKFCSYNFDNSAEGIMMLQMVMNQSQYESSKQGCDVKRGMIQKAASGERPGVVPTGYMKVPKLDEHSKPIIRPKDNKIVTVTDFDPERIDLVKKMWDMLLSGLYTPRRIRKIANEEWKYTLRKPSKDSVIGGKSLGLSTLYRVFNNPFYTGWIKHNGELHEGNHKPIITFEQFDYAQILMGKRGKP